MNSLVPTTSLTKEQRTEISKETNLVKDGELY